LIMSDVIARYELLCKQRQLPDANLKLILKNRFSWKRLQQGETERERVFSVHNYANCVSNGAIPVSQDLAHLLTGLMCHIELGQLKSSVSKQTVGIKIMEMIRQYYPPIYLHAMSSDALNFLCLTIQTFWTEISNSRATQVDCIRAYLTVVRSWRFRDCRFFSFSRQREKDQILVSVGEDGLAFLRIASFECITSYTYQQLVSFGGKKGKLQLAFSLDDEDTKRYELLGPYSQVGEVVALISDYISEQEWLTRHVTEYRKTVIGKSNLGPTGDYAAGPANKHDSLMVLRC
jgi:hypothetical protein